MYYQDIEKELEVLQDTILNLEIHYLEPHVNTIPPSDKTILDCKAFCILSHAAFENFAEELAMSLLEETIENFSKFKRISYSMAMLLHFMHMNPSVDYIADTQYDYTRKLLDSIKNHYSRMIFDNHGVSKKYLRNLYIPLGIDVPSDSRLNGSLESLAAQRGEFAHKSPMRTAKLPNPSDLSKNASDVCELLTILTKRVRAIMFYPWRQI